jgi:hypothetical protein
MLGREVAGALLGVIQSGKIEEAEALGNAVKLMNECQKLAAAAARKPAQARGQEDATINRDAEASQVATSRLSRAGKCRQLPTDQAGSIGTLAAAWIE